MAGPKLVFLEVGRGLPGLRRGWRTPDPSPSPYALGLPGCAAGEFSVVDCGDESGEIISPKQVVPKLAIGGIMKNEEEAYSKGRDSTPRKPLWHEVGRPKLDLASATDQNFDAADEVPTPKGHSPMTCSTSASPARARRWADETDDEDLPTPRRGSTNWELNMLGPWGNADASSVPSPPQPWSGGADAEVLDENARAMAALSYASPAQEASEDVPPVPEIANNAGSVGHPENCGLACKFARKARGCKDGDDCVRCHICRFKPPRKRRVADANVVPATEETPSE